MSLQVQFVPLARLYNPYQLFPRSGSLYGDELMAVHFKNI